MYGQQEIKKTDLSRDFPEVKEEEATRENRYFQEECLPYCRGQITTSLFFMA